MRKSRGSVLIHVLITGVIVAFIAAGLLRMVMMNYIVVERAAKGAQNRKETEAILDRVTTYWTQNGVCTTVPFFGACSAPASPCLCTGAALGGPTPPSIRVSGAAPGPYTMVITSSDPP